MMKSLLKYLSPFAPDHSGAVSVLFDFGGMIVICDAGGCTGNVCGFDEPRWFTRRSAIFSAGLRDMDAILGRDEKLVEKLERAAVGSGFAFIALIGTPVPAVIGTDFRALSRMAQKRTGLPVLALDTVGTGLYDKGASKAFVNLFQTFANKKLAVENDAVGVLGATVLDFNSGNAGNFLADYVAKSGWKNICVYGMGAGLTMVSQASRVAKNLVAAPCGAAAARDLAERFGTPYEWLLPPVPEMVTRALPPLIGKKILVIHQQFAACAVREKLQDLGASHVDVASFFMMEPELMRGGDFAIASENDFVESVFRVGYEAIVCDKKLTRALRGFTGTVVDFPHFAVSGRVTEGTD